jgi:hypothetical protein
VSYTVRRPETDKGLETLASSVKGMNFTQTQPTLPSWKLEIEQVLIPPARKFPAFSYFHE